MLSDIMVIVITNCGRMDCIANTCVQKLGTRLNDSDPSCSKKNPDARDECVFVSIYVGAGHCFTYQHRHDTIWFDIRPDRRLIATPQYRSPESGSPPPPSRPGAFSPPSPGLTFLSRHSRQKTDLAALLRGINELVLPRESPSAIPSSQPGPLPVSTIQRPV